MKLPAYLDSLWEKFFHHSAVAEEMEEELRSHIALRADDLERAGLSRSQADRTSADRAGGRENGTRKKVTRRSGGGLFEGLFRDPRFAGRVLRKSPGFVLAAVVTLALAIGANAVFFSIMNVFVLQPVHVPVGQYVYELQRGDAATAYESYPNYLDLRDRNHTFTSVMAWNIALSGLDTGDNPTREWIVEASGNYFDGLGIQAYIGHFFHASDERGPNSAPYIVLGYAFWHTHFQGDRGVIGRVVQLDKHPFTIIGVTPPDLHGMLLLIDPNIYVPIVNMMGPAEMNDRENRWIFMTMGVLEAGRNDGAGGGRSECHRRGTGAELSQASGQDDLPCSPAPDCTARSPGQAGGRGDTLAALMALAGLILLAACANLGSLFSARAADRAKEVALRLALGSNRRRILRGLFAEAMLVSLLVARWGCWASIALLRAS